MKSITLPINDLRCALAGFAKVAPRRATLPVLTSIKINRDRNGAIRMQATDLDSYATYKLPVTQSPETAEFLVPIDQLQKAAKGAKDEVVLYQEDAESIIIQTKISNTPVEEKILCIPLAEWPAPPEMPIATLSVDEKFQDTFAQALQCASEDESRYIINSVCLDVGDKKGHYVVSTNGRMLFSANSFYFGGLKQSLVVPTRKFLRWSGWWTEPCTNLAVRPPEKGDKPEEPEKPGWLLMENGPWTFLTKQVAGPYPNWKQVVPKDGFKTTIRIPEESTASMLEVLARIPGDYEPNYPVVLNVTKNGLVLEGQNKDQKEAAHVPIPGAQVEGTEQRVCLNRHYLAKGLRFGLAEIHLIDEVSPLLLKHEGKQMVIMPVRFEGNTPKPADNPPPPPPTTAEAASQNQPEPATETTTAANIERNEMTKTNTHTESRQEQSTEAPESPLKRTLQKLDTIKDTLRQVFADLGDAAAALKQAEKEKKATDKEVEQVREKLREIQSVSI